MRASGRALTMRHFVGVGLVSLLAPREAHACPCQRPTDPGGFNGYDYGAAPVQFHDGQSVRVWYVTTGPHAVNPASTQADMTPDNVVTATTVGDAALASYAQLGFTAPISDQGTTGCCGGDPKLDIYLMHFNANADGDSSAEGCQTVGKARKCWSFGMVEAKLENGYGTFALGAHIVIAHELFHAVQDAYDEGLDRFWAEGTAQWAAKTIYPTETDLETNLPAFFSNAGQSIDTSGGVVAGYLYGSAIWPVFLTEHVDPNAVRGAFQQEAMLGAPSMAAIDASLPAFNSSLADAYPTFVAWNAGTGTRAGMGGYANASTYPEATLTPFPASNTVSDIATGYSAFFYSYDFGATTQTLTLTGDATRVGARTFPLAGGKARLDQIANLPATVTGTGVVVVAGISAKKSDAPFKLTAGPPMGAGGAGSTGASTGAGGSGGGKAGGCSCSTAPDPSTPAWLAGMGLIAVRCLRRRHRGSVDRDPV